MTDLTPLHFYDDLIEVLFDSPPALEKSPPCPNGFLWRGQTFRVTESLSEWADFARRGRNAKNMRPAHAAVAAGLPWVRLNDYPAGQTYDASNPPAMLPDSMDKQMDRTVVEYARYIIENVLGK